MSTENPPEFAAQEHLVYEGNDLPWYVVVMWVVSLIGLIAYTVVWYIPDLQMWMSK